MAAHTACFPLGATARPIRRRFIDQNDDAALSPRSGSVPALVLIETPSNPLMRVRRYPRDRRPAKAAGAKVAVDNTFLSPALQRPIALGADFVVHSTTKYLNGHSDVVGGAVIAADKGDAEALAAWANVTGVTGSPFDAYLTLRGLRTCSRASSASSQPRPPCNVPGAITLVDAVHYPGLNRIRAMTSPSAQRGFGAMLSFELAGGVEERPPFVEACRCFTLAESLGGVESLVAHPATMTHAGMGAEARRAAGIGDTLLRLSIGLEAESDIIAGLESGLAAVLRAT